MAAFPHSPSLVTAFVLCGLWLLNFVRAKLNYHLKMSKSGAKEPPQYPHKDPILGIDLFLEYKKAFEEGRFLTTTLRHFENFGDTFKANSFGTTVIKTRDPRVSKAFHATQFEKFGLQPLRYENSKDLFGNSIIMVDGPAWAHARALIRPSFETVHIANFERLNRHVDRFMSLLPKDSSTVDLFPLFKLLVWFYLFTVSSFFRKFSGPSRLRFNLRA